MSTLKTRQMFEDYRHFVDGLILSFEYFYAPHRPLAARMVFHARNHAAPDNAWRKVEVTVRDVQEVFANVKGNGFNAICSGVTLLNAGDLWCVDVDGNYAMAAAPATLDDVRADGECYVIGREIDAVELLE